jgi:effector-binding domain-containing protein
MGKAYGEISTFAAKNKIDVKGAPFAIYHRWDSVTMFSVMDLGMPIASEGRSEGRVRAVTIPAQRVVQARYFGPYENTAATYRILDQYLLETGLESNGGPWEIYITDPMVEKDTAKWETAIVFPVK